MAVWAKMIELGLTKVSIQWPLPNQPTKESGILLEIKTI
jgi:hypothetical protein